jgi:hypothetical protein
MQGMPPTRAPGEFAVRIRSEIANWCRVIKEADIKSE